MTVVQCNFYQLYERGIKESKLANPKTGNLVLFKCDDGTNRLFRIRAVLRGANGEALLPMLDHAMVERITDTAGIVIKDTELVARSKSIKSQIGRYPQSWWCQVVESIYLKNCP